MEESICTSPWSTTRPFVLLIPKASVASVLFNLFFTNPQKGQGREKWQAKPKLLRALNSLADSVAGACLCVCVCVCEKVPRFTTNPLLPTSTPSTPHPLCTVGLCNGGGPWSDHMSGGVCRQQGIIQRPLSMFGHPSPHHHSGTLKARAHTGTSHTHTHTHTHLILRAH